MALKRQKFRKYTIKEKMEIIKECNKGVSSLYLEKNMEYLIILSDNGNINLEKMVI